MDQAYAGANEFINQLYSENKKLYAGIKELKECIRLHSKEIQELKAQLPKNKLNQTPETQNNQAAKSESSESEEEDKDDEATGFKKI